MTQSKELDSRLGSDRQEPLVLVCVSDDGYAMPLAVMLYSALSTYCGPGPAEVFILDAGISLKNQHKIRKILRPFDINLNWCIPNPESLAGVPLTKKFTLATYYRLLIPEVLPQHLRKALYLDCDTLIVGDINELWKMDIEKNVLLAVPDSGKTPSASSLSILPKKFTDRLIGECEDIAVTEADGYFNAGVMLLNLDIFRDQQLSRKIIAFSKKWPHLIKSADQDGLNAICIRQWGALDFRWNCFLRYADSIAFQPKIIHYSGVIKPWKRIRTTFSRSSQIGYCMQLWDEYLVRSSLVYPAGADGLLVVRPDIPNFAPL